MPFPFSIDAVVVVPLSAVPSGIDLPARVLDALRSETVDNVSQRDDLIFFRADLKPRSPRPRPGGHRSVFDLFDRGEIKIVEAERDVRFAYRLSTRVLFGSVTLIAAAATIAINLNEGPRTQGGYAFGLFIWTTMFLLQYFKKRREFRRWLISIATFPTLPEPAPLRYDGAS